MMPIESEDWNELVRLLKDTEESLAAVKVEDHEKEMERSRQSIVSFHTTAAMFGLEGLEKAGLEFEKFLTGSISPGDMDSIAALGFAIGTVIDQMRDSKNGNGHPEIDLNEILEILAPTEAAESTPTERTSGEDALPLESAPEHSGSVNETGLQSPEEDASDLDFTNLSMLVKGLGGALSVSTNGDSTPKFSLAFTGSASSLKRIEKLLSSGDSEDSELKRVADEAAVNNLVEKGKEFMEAFSNGDILSAQKILLRLADQQGDSAGLYKEVGVLARGLHDSIRGFLSSIDPSLSEIVEDKIPDSGNRLEHILEMTEKAAVTTLDNVETIQERLSGEMEQITKLRGILGGLNAIGDSACKKLDQGAQTLDAMETLIAAQQSDLDVILTAQDYQDLSGQIILKITQLLKDIEGKLVNLIRTFGVKAEGAKQKTESSELYGPAHAAVENAVHSQDEVDSMLAEFGF